MKVPAFIVAMLVSAARAVGWIFLLVAPSRHLFICVQAGPSLRSVPLAAMAIIVFAVLAGSAPGLSVLFIAVQGALRWLGLVAGAWLQRHDEAYRRPLNWRPVARAVRLF